MLLINFFAAGAGSGIKGALGYGPAGSDPSTWTWVPATFNTDTGGGANDEFQAQLPNPGTGAYKFAFRFNHQDGPWSYCDADGLALDGFTEAQAGTLTVTTEGIDSCKLQFPDTLTSYEGRPSDQVYGRVLVTGLTEATGAGAGLEGQVGYGPTGSAPSDPTWVWSPNGTFNVDDGTGGDEYQATFTGPAPGAYLFTYRFRLNGGAWTYCDKDGSANGVQAAQLGALTAAPFDVTNCVLENANSAQTVLPNTVTQPFGALVSVPTLTEGMGQGTPLVMEIGSGAVGTAPSSWTNWTAATFAADATLADRYTGTVTSSMTTGAYAVAFRARVGTRPYVYCDQDGSQNGFTEAQAGHLTVAGALLTACKLESVSTPALASGSPLTVTARATIPGVTSNAGAAPNLRVQIGLGATATNASTSNLWGWKDASYSAEASGADEFSLTIFPAYTGGREVSARASLDGVSWLHCDLNGSDVGGYEQAQQYYVNVTPHVDIDYCKLQFPASSGSGGTVYGRVYEANVTPNPAAPITAQLGVGRETEDPAMAWQWYPAAFNAQTMEPNNNEYAGTLPPDAGGLNYAFRFTIDAGVWCYGDLNGSTTGGFSGGSNVGTVTP